MPRRDESTGKAVRVYAAVLRVGRIVRRTRTGNVGLTFHWEVPGVPVRGEPVGLTFWVKPEQMERRRRAMARLSGCRRDAATARRLLANATRCLVLWQVIGCPDGSVDHRVVGLRYL